MREVLFVHGALVRDGAWWWGPVARRLEAAAQVRSRALLLPSCGETAEADPAAGLADDASALHRVLDDADGDVLVVGHSYGGTVIAEGADHPAARTLLYISSYLPDPGVAQSGILADEPDPVAVAPGADGRLVLAGLDEAGFSARFLQDVADPEIRAGAWKRVTPQSAAAFTTPTTTAAWRGRDSTYLVCTEDRSTSLGLQRHHAARATRSVDLPAGHHPFLSDPDAVAREVLRLVG